MTEAVRPAASQECGERRPGLLLALFPVVSLIALLGGNVWMFGADASEGPNQLALFFAAVLTTAIGTLYLRVPYRRFEEEMMRSIGFSIQALLILLVIGALISLWIMSGIVPTMIYYGLLTLSPSVFLPVACLIAIVVSGTTGSSWSTAGTIGIALIAIGNALKIPEGMVAGSVISGGLFWR